MNMTRLKELWEEFPSILIVIGAVAGFFGLQGIGVATLWVIGLEQFIDSFPNRMIWGMIGSLMVFMIGLLSRLILWPFLLTLIDELLRLPRAIKKMKDDSRF